MTSKEALKLLYSDAENYAYLNETEEDLSEIKAEYELIKQDLEVLEILRKHIKNKVDWNKHILKIYETTIYAYDVDDFNKIKEWLQNDK